MRIIAGTHRGRPLKAPKGMATRPTTDRVREALFAVLGNIEGAHALDCYAGSGALGLEALSRGATDATFIELGKDAAQTIEHNARTLQLSERVTLWRTALEKVRVPAATRWDLVLSDPPWPICQPAALAVLKLVLHHLNPDARIVLGHPVRQPLQLPEVPGLRVDSTRSWGDSAVTLLSWLPNET